MSQQRSSSVPRRGIPSTRAYSVSTPTISISNSTSFVKPSILLPSPPLSPTLVKASLSPIVTFTVTDHPLNSTSYEDGARMERGVSNTSQFLPLDSSEFDPLLLRTRMHPAEQITELRQRKSSKKALGEFYARQNQQIQSLLKPLNDHIDEAKEEEDTSRMAIKIAIWASFIANICLAILQLYAAISSLSLSFFATGLDAIFDPFANLVLLYCHRKAKSVDLHRYPGGGSRFETIGEIVYSGVMGGASVILIAFSVQSLVSHTSDSPPEEFHLVATIAVALSFAVKLSLFLYCYPLKEKNTQVKALWLDHRNDVAINLLGLFTSAAGAKIQWYIDPLGAIVIALILIALWGTTLYSHFTRLAGVAAPLEFLQLVIYKCMTYQESIEAIDNCIAYSSGPKYIVEVDIVMHADTPLWKAHDISQELQDKLEELPLVERAFVHVDHEVSHKAEHRKLN